MMKITQSKKSVFNIKLPALSHMMLQIFVLILICFSANAEDNTQTNRTPENHQPLVYERYLLKYKEGTKEEMAPIIGRNGGEILMTLEKHRLLAIHLYPHLIQRLIQYDQVERIEVDEKNYLYSETVPYGIPMVQANALGMTEAPNTDRKVCIIDSGFNLGHEDLQDQRITGDDGIMQPNGTITHDTGFWYDDESGHGTMVAGIIAALGGNSKGVIGVNPGNRLYLHIVKAFVSTNAGSWWVYTSTSIAALDQCIAAGAHIVNMSYGKTSYTQAENQAFIAARQAGILLIAASGNINANNGNVNRYPATLDAVISVGSVDSTETVNSNSVNNFAIDFVAPGANVLSTAPSNLFGGNLYHTYTTPGTSLAAAYVSGVAALVWGHFPNCTARQIAIALANTAKDKGVPGKDRFYGHGIVQAKAAFDAISASMAVNGTCSVPKPPLQLQKGVTQNSLIASGNSELKYVLNVSSGSTPTNPTFVEDLSFTTTGGTGDVELYVKYGSLPSTTDYDCMSNVVGNNELCDITNPQEGDYFVMVRSPNLFYGVSLLGDYTISNVQPSNFGTSNNSGNTNSSSSIATLNSLYMVFILFMLLGKRKQGH